MKDTASIRFLGAAETVTGSKFLISHAASRVLVDCGMYQGQREHRRRNWEPFPVPAEEVEAVVLSHAHLDHCGWLPRLVLSGFHGPVYCSVETARVAPIVLRDAAHLQEEDAAYAARKGYSRHHPPQPLFDTADAEKAIALLHPLRFGAWHPVTRQISVRLRRAGHILGSATVEIHAGDSSVAFSGDLGRTDHPLLRPPDPAPQADNFVIESTYGDRPAHPPRDLTSLSEPIARALHRGGVVLIPAFAVDRTPVLLMALRELMHAGRLPTVSVFVDSPMALTALQVYRDAVRASSPEIRETVLDFGGDPFDPGDLRLAPSHEDSIKLNDIHGPCIIISASGMATGGRVVHHLERLVTHHRNLILLPGFQVPGTRGRALLDGAHHLKMYGRYVPVHAEVVGLDAFSAHADADAMISWLGAAPAPPHTCFVVHGEPNAASAMADRIQHELGWTAIVPRYDEKVLL
jgi:metallo-beta-lactamase family protein